MDRVLKETVVPELRARGFQGSLPHFRRLRPDRIGLLTCQFYLSGGKFIVELAQCGPEGDTTSWARGFRPAKSRPTISMTDCGWVDDWASAARWDKNQKVSRKS